MRVFSRTLPFHGPGFDNQEAMGHWAHELAGNHNLFAPFIQETQKEIQGLIRESVIDPAHLGVMGLSRGAFVAAHLAAKEPLIKTLLGFAPLTALTGDHPLFHTLSLENIAHALIGKRVRFYIGNRDERVKTASCFSLIEHLADLNWHHGHRSPPVELIISPSIGYKGHGTPPEVFRDGARWLCTSLRD